MVTSEQVAEPSHDMRVPLTSIVGHLEMIEAELGGGAEVWCELPSSADAGTRATVYPDTAARDNAPEDKPVPRNSLTRNRVR